MDDLAGTLLRAGGWTLLSLPAIAEQDEWIRIGDHAHHHRRVGDPLQPNRESFGALASLRAQLGSDTFAAQYQQAPIPPGGAMIKRDWLKYYERLPDKTPSTEVVQSWDTASKNGGQNDWSVCTTWLLIENEYYLMDVVRDRCDYPTLRTRAVSHAQQHRPNRIFVEDADVGTALITELKNARFPALPVKPEHNKQVRMSIQSIKFENGRVLFPKNAPWLADLEAELLAFPNGRHDDQVDSISQALTHELARRLYTAQSNANLERFYRELGGRQGMLSSHSTYEAMGIGGIQAYLLGLSG
jgi:predicted phage terminase large subunit-like protein